MTLCLRIPQLALMTDAQNSHKVALRREAVKSDETRFASRDNELPQAVLDQAPYKRMFSENGDRLVDRMDLPRCELRIVLGVEVEYALEILERARGEAYLRQDLGLGRRAGLPSARAVM